MDIFLTFPFFERSLEELYAFIVRDKKRPALAEDMLPSLKALIHAMWNPNPVERPGFAVVRRKHSLHSFLRLPFKVFKALPLTLSTKHEFR